MLSRWRDRQQVRDIPLTDSLAEYGSAVAGIVCQHHLHVYSVSMAIVQAMQCSLVGVKCTVQTKLLLVCSSSTSSDPGMLCAIILPLQVRV